MPNIQAEMMKTTTTHPATAFPLSRTKAFLLEFLSDALATADRPYHLLNRSSLKAFSNQVKEVCRLRLRPSGLIFLLTKTPACLKCDPNSGPKPADNFTIQK
jgi:hypothetical protein